MGLLAWAISTVIELRKIMFSPINGGTSIAKKKKKVTLIFLMSESHLVENSSYSFLQFLFIS